MTRPTSAKALLLVGLLGAWAARAEERLFAAPIGPADKTKPEAQALQRYLDGLQANFTVLDTIMSAPPKDQQQAADQVTGACTSMQALLDQAAEADTPKGAKAPRTYAGYIGAHTILLRATCERASATARTLATMTAATVDIETNWLKKLGSKKSKLQKTAEEPALQYRTISTYVTMSGDSDRFTKKLEEFKLQIPVAEALGKDTERLRVAIEDAVKNGNPDTVFKPQVDALSVTLVTPSPALPADEPFWLLHRTKWRDQVAAADKRHRDAWGKLAEESKSLLGFRFFRDAGEPLDKLEYVKFRQTFQALYDKLAKQHDELFAQAQAEEERWQADRERILELINDTGPTARRELVLKDARIDSAALDREIKLLDARSDGPGGKNPDAAAERDRLVAQRDVDRKAIKKEREDFDKRDLANMKEIERICKDNAKRRKDLKMVDRPLCT